MPETSFIVTLTSAPLPGIIAGVSTAIADFGFLRLSGYLGWLMWLFVHILFLVGFKNRLSVMLQWAAVTK